MLDNFDILKFGCKAEEKHLSEEGGVTEQNMLIASLFTIAPMTMRNRGREMGKCLCSWMLSQGLSLIF